jgi:hypothetical protein
MWFFPVAKIPFGRNGFGTKSTILPRYDNPLEIP